MQLTNEQQLIVTSAKNGNDLAIRAYAGCGKSHTLRLIAKEVMKPTLCLAFNKSIAAEMQSSMEKDGSAWVTCQTINSLAWRAVVKYSKSAYANKLAASLQFSDIVQYVDDLKDILNEDLKVELILKVAETITTFCNSDKVAVGNCLVLDESLLVYEERLKNMVKKYWDMVSSDKHPASMSHDVYVKLFQLSKPKLLFSVVMVDEFQDLNECNLDIIYNQKQHGTQLIVVGDTNQEIFGFRSSVTAFKTLPDYFIQNTLSESFRFTPEIAAICTKLIQINGEKVPVIGRATLADIKQTAYIARTNMEVLKLAISFIKSGKSIHVIGDFAGIQSKLYHTSALLSGNSPKFPNKELTMYKTAKQLLSSAERQQELRTLINLTKFMLEAGGITNCLNMLREETMSLEKAEIVVATCHKLKGLGFDSVVVGDDFIRSAVEDVENSLSALREELKLGQTLELLYVAISRARYAVRFPENVQVILDNSDRLINLGEYDGI